MNKIARSWLITIHWWISVSFSGSLDSITPRGPLSADLHQRDLSIRGRSQHPSFDPIILSNSNPESAPRISPRRRTSSEVSFDPYGEPEWTYARKLKSRVRQIDRRVVDRWLAATPLFEQLPVDPDYRSAGIRFGFPSVKLGFALKRRIIWGNVKSMAWM